jgi:hypothetical protein
MTDRIQPNKRPGAPLGNQNARKHGFYSTRLKTSEKRVLEAASCVNGLDQEIAILRARIKVIMDTAPDNHELLIKAMSALTRMTRAKDQLRHADAHDIARAINELYGSMLGPGRTFVGEDDLIGYFRDSEAKLKTPQKDENDAKSDTDQENSRA